MLMRTHSGLHVLCGVVFRDFGALVTGGNMEPGEARMDFNLPEVPPDFKARLEELVNAEVVADRRIDVRVLGRDEALALPDIIRTQSNLIPADEQEIRIVDIVGLDVQADGGTHVAVDQPDRQGLGGQGGEQGQGQPPGTGSRGRTDELAPAEWRPRYCRRS